MVEEKKNKRKFIRRLLDKYRLVILNENTFEEIRHIKLHKLNMITLGGTFIIILVTLTYLAIAHTPIRETIPGYPDAEMKNNIIKNSFRLDSLENELKFRDQYFANLNQIISGGVPVDFISQRDYPDSAISKINFTRSQADSLLRREIEFTDKIGIPSETQKNEDHNLQRIHFFTPVKGLVTNSFNSLTSHFGTDVVATPDAVVKAVLDGTVIMATWTIETGNIIQIQHSNNLISVYKHNAELLKKSGAQVKAGDAIAIVGNSGELTTGPHLHFELWQNGVPLNPEDYIGF